jgi:hypothetical protein
LSAPRGRAIRWHRFTGTVRVFPSTTVGARAVPFHPGGNSVQESLPLILSAAILLMAFGVMSGVVIVAGLALYDEQSETMERPR